jgi:predicted RNase H-like HicB family nuclease
MREYAVIFERGTGKQAPWGAYVPDLSGCVSLGETREEIKRNIREAIGAHVELMAMSGETVPEPRAQIGAAVAAMRRYAIVYIPGPEGWTATAPDFLDEIGVTAATRQEAEELICCAIQSRVESMAAEGAPIPEPTCELGMVAAPEAIAA